MNTFPLNRTTLNGRIRYATSAGLEGETGMLFIVSESNLSPMVGSASMAFTTTGVVSSQIILSAAPVTMTFSVTGNALFNNQFLIGTTGIAFDATGTMNTIRYISGETLLALEATGSMKNLGRLAGQVTVEFTMNGDPLAIRFMEGAAVFALDITGDLSINPSSVDDDQRTFRRPFKNREFAR